MGKKFTLWAWLVYCCGLMVILLFKGNEHDWMLQMDPSVKVVDESGNRLIFTTLVLVLMLMIQAGIFMKSDRSSSRTQSVAASLLAIAIWYFYGFKAVSA